MSEQTQHSFLLRVWRGSPKAPWRANLINVARPDERYHFASLDELYAFIEQQIEIVIYPPILNEATSDQPSIAPESQPADDYQGGTSPGI